MLVELSIRDLALIETAELELGAGLNVVTGETGAGKTLLVGSLELLLGLAPAGGAAKLVRRGASEARVEGRFVVEARGLADAVRACLAEELPELAEEWEESGGELILGRRLGAEGRTRAHVNQRPVPLRALRRLAPLLLEIHGQNEHQRLLESAEQRALLDDFGATGKALARYREVREQWLALVEEGRALCAAAEERRERLELLRFQCEELDEARLAAGERAELTAERKLLRSAAELRGELGGLQQLLAEGDDALGDRLRAAEEVVERWKDVAGALAGVEEDLRAAGVHVEEAATALASVLDSVDVDPARLEEVEERLAELERLEAKYRRDEAGLIAYREQAAREIEGLEDQDASAQEIDAAIADALATVESAARKLTRGRRAAGPRLAKAARTALADLGLAKARFEVALVPHDAADAPERRLAPAGAEAVEFRLAANPGEDLAPLKHVASGGETARIMLALRSVLSAAGHGHSLVFDEIDAGVGGRLGPEVGAHLRRLADRGQVLCVTHLPAIAAQADRHLCVSKSTRGERTRTEVRALEGEERVSEVADMIAGGADHETARAEARRLLGAAR